jgi:hypothetical protein
MRITRADLKVIATTVALGLPELLTQTAFADTSSATPVESFIKAVIQVLAGLAGLVATGFFVVGGFGYIMSSGNPEHLHKSKQTLLYSAIGLSITIAAFVLSNIVTGLANSAFGS